MKKGSNYILGFFNGSVARKFSRISGFALVGLLAAGPLSSQEPRPFVDPNIRVELRAKEASRVIVELRQTSVESVGSASSFLSQTFGLGDTLQSLSADSAVARINAASLSEMEKNPFISTIIKDEADPPALVEVAPKHAAPSLWTPGITGKQLTIAIIDTGIDMAHPAFKGKIVGQACFSVENKAEQIESLCIGGEKLANGDHIDVSPTAATGCKNVVGCDHGTHVAGIAAGNQVVDAADGKTIAGIAKDANIFAIQVFSKYNKSQDCGGKAPCIKSFRSAQRRALELIHSNMLRRIALGTGPEIVAVNMSLGGRVSFDDLKTFVLSPAHCDRVSVLTRRIKSLGEDGAQVFVASGNDSSRTGISHPACISHAVAVGALEKDLKMASYSNLVSDMEENLVKITAIGSNVRSAGVGGGFRLDSGTSMATPVVSGAYTLLRQAFPERTREEILAALFASNTQVPDPANAMKKYPVLALDQAYTLLKSGKALAEHSRTDTSVVAGSGSGGGTPTASRFIIQLREQDARSASASIQNASVALSQALGVASVTTATTGRDTINLTVDRPISTAVLRAELEKVLPGQVDGIFADQADTPRKN